MRKKHIYFCDFETVTVNTKYFKKHNDTRVILWHIKNWKGDLEFTGVDIKSFFETITTKINSPKANFYFHNLSFDGDFILKYLASIGFVCANSYKEDERLKQPNTFTFLRQTSTIYFINTYFKAKLGVIERRFLCSLKILSTSIKNLGKSLKIEKYENIKNIEEFYDVEPQQSLEFYNPNYIDYCKRDVEILRLSFINFVDTLQAMYKEYKFLHHIDLDKKFTIGSVAYSIQDDFVYRYAIENNKKEIYEGFKIDLQTYELAAKFYFGGITQFNPNYQLQKVECESGKGYDVNSMHPSSMRKLLPYGKMHNYKDELPLPNKQILNYLHLKIESAISLNGNFLCLANWNKLNKEGVYTNHRYVGSLFNFECYYLEDEFETLKKFYEFKGVKVINKYWCYADTYLKDYVDALYFYKEKHSRENNPGKALTYKIALNSSYGKHATRIDFSELYSCRSIEEQKYLLDSKEFLFKNKNWVVDDAGEVVKLDNNYFVKLKPTEFKKEKLFNKLVASTITAWSRILLYNAIFDLGEENFLYCDTDSIYVKNSEKESVLDIDNYRIGAWGIIDTFKYFVVKGAKAYAYGVDENFEGRYKAVHSGINNSWLAKNFEIGLFETEDIVLELANITRQNCKSGIVLIKKDYTSKPRLH